MNHPTSTSASVIVIAELSVCTLEPQRWGYKAVRLSEASRLGLPVPPGLCVQYPALVDSSSIGALTAWLDVYRPDRVVIRMSSILEDRVDTARAGHTLSILNCPPDATALLRIIRQDILPDVDPWCHQGGGLSLIVQEQVQSRVAGVAAYIENRLQVECAARSTDAVTSGATPELRADVKGDTGHAEGLTSASLPVFSVVAALRAAGTRLTQHFGDNLDVEWAWALNTLFVLQVRPLTVAPWAENP